MGMLGHIRDNLTTNTTNIIYKSFIIVTQFGVAVEKVMLTCLKKMQRRAEHASS